MKDICEDECDFLNVEYQLGTAIVTACPGRQKTELRNWAFLGFFYELLFLIIFTVNSVPL
jgi:hypothetical protein